MYRGNSSTRNTNQANSPARAYSIHPIIFCLIGIAGFQPVILVFAAERCVAPEATRVVSVQGNVTWSVVNSAALEPAKLNDLLCVGDTVRVGTKSRAVLRLPNETTIPLDQNTIFQLKQAIAEKEPTIIELIQGAIHVITRTPKPFKVNTPYMNAAVEGTEFYVGVDSEEARVAVIEGKVNVSNELGALLLTDNEAATARQGQAPQKTLTIKPRDAVQWALYYPPLFDPRSRPGAQNLSVSYELYSQGKITEAIASLDAIPEAERSDDFYTYRAGLLLLVGRADEAEPDIEAALKENGNNTDALSLKAIIAIVQNDKAKALELANQAVSIDDKSASARIALSYALQANFEIEEALRAAREATERDANNALAWARVAELELSIPSYDKSKEAAERAVKLNPNLARIQSVLGFASLTRVDIKAAKESFNNAIELDQADPLPRLGLGLAMIREGKFEQGREQIEIAASLNPENSLIRSYLGKAYYEERRDPEASMQFELAKERDPKDPTPYFYDAVRKQTENHPIEALGDLEKSIELNDNRAVYRSRLQLESDVVARNADTALVFRQLGFKQLALVEGAKALAFDPSSFSAHNFLMTAFEDLPRHDIARQSEGLQTQLWQTFPILSGVPNLTDADQLNSGILKDINPGSPAYNEITPLLAGNKLRLRVSGLMGQQSTAGHQVIVSGLSNRISFSLSKLHYDTDGFRVNNDFEKDIYNGFVHFDATPSFAVQAELRKFSSERGDQVLRFDPDLFFLDRGEFEGDYARFGARWTPSIRSSFLFSAISIDATNVAKASEFRITEAFRTNSFETQYLWRGEPANLIVGIGNYRQHKNVDTTFDFQDSNVLNASNIYLYSTIKNRTNGLQIQLGSTYDKVEAETGIAIETQRQFNPKLGVVWNVNPSATIRLAGMRTLKRSFLISQTLEPTQFAGFNQFYDDPVGSDARRYGLGFDYKFSHWLFGGWEASLRNLRVPQSGEFFDWRERLGQIYLYWTATERLGGSVALEYEKLTRDPLLPGAELFLEATTRSVPVSITYSHNSISAKLETTLVSQTGLFFTAPLSAEASKDSDRFWISNLSFNYRLPRARGSVGFEVRNLFNKKFKFQETDVVHPRFARERFFVARGTVNF